MNLIECIIDKRVLLLGNGLHKGINPYILTISTNDEVNSNPFRLLVWGGDS